MVYTRKPITGQYKARLVTLGYEQVEGVDFVEKYSPTGQAAVHRIHCAVIASEDREVVQGDISGAFLHAPLDETIYVRVGKEVWKLKKALYGLKQAPRQWHLHLKKGMVSLGFRASLVDPDLYIKEVMDGGQMLRLYFFVHVDDFWLSAPKGRKDLIDEVVVGLQKLYTLREVKEPDVFCGVEVVRNRENRTLKLSQKLFIQDLLEKWMPSSSVTKDVPATPGVRLSRMGAPLSTSRAREYREVVGSLLWCSNRTRPDIAQAVGSLTRHYSSPTEEHWKAAMDVLLYLRGTIDFGLVYGSGSLVGYADAAYNVTDDAKSYTGFCFILHGAVISWTSKLQVTVATSVQHAEYMAAGSAAREGVWLRMVLKEFGFDVSDPTLIYGDCVASNRLIDNPIITPKTKHINVIWHYTREQVESGELVFEYISTDKMIADLFTKALPFPAFVKHRASLGVSL